MIQQQAKPERNAAMQDNHARASGTKTLATCLVRVAGNSIIVSTESK